MVIICVQRTGPSSDTFGCKEGTGKVDRANKEGKSYLISRSERVLTIPANIDKVLGLEGRFWRKFLLSCYKLVRNEILDPSFTYPKIKFLSKQRHDAILRRWCDDLLVRIGLNDLHLQTPDPFMVWRPPKGDRDVGKIPKCKTRERGSYHSLSFRSYRE